MQTQFIFPDKSQFPKTWDCLEKGVAEGVAPGMVAGVVRNIHPHQYLLFVLGHRRLGVEGLSPLPMEFNTVFDLASVSKVMGAATLAARAVDRGALDWDLPLSAIFPDYVNALPKASQGITLAHLLSHTAGFPAWEAFWEKMRARFAPKPLEEISVSERQKAMRQFVFNVRPTALPGECAVYSDISFLILGFALEEILGRSLDSLVDDWVFKPMGLEGAYYQRVTRSTKQGEREVVAATEICSWRGGLLQGQVHDDNCWSMGGYGGHAGVFARAQDVLLFAQRMMSGFLSSQVLHRAWTRVERPRGCERTLGWDTPSIGVGQETAARGFSPSSVGHLGFTGTSLWIDREAQLAVTLLTNRVHPSRENSKIKIFRSHFHQALREDLG